MPYEGKDHNETKHRLQIDTKTNPKESLADCIDQHLH